MLGIGTYEILFIIIVAVIVLGPEHLPKILRTVQKVMSDVRKVSTEFQRTLNLEDTLAGSDYHSTMKKAGAKKKKKKKKPATDETAAEATDTAHTASTPADQTAEKTPSTEHTLSAEASSTEAPAAKDPEEKTPAAPSSPLPNTEGSI